MDGQVSAPDALLSMDELEAGITRLAGQLNAAQHRFLVLIAEFDRREGWQVAGARSCAHWLNWKVGLDLGAAREKLRVAHALGALPAIAAAMARGALSYSKVRALTRVAEPATEAYFLSIALDGTAQHVERLVRSYRRVRQVEELAREARQQARRELSWYHDEDGSLVLKARLTAEAGAALVKALEVAVESMPIPRPADVSAETSVPREPVAARRAEALGLIAEGYLHGGGVAVRGGDRQQVVVHVDAATLEADESGRCEFEEGPSMGAETARRLACDASVVRILEDGRGEPLDVGRKTRSIPPALRRALTSRDRGCRFPGCTHTRHVDGHHIEHWAQGGETKLDNLVLLCRFHHRLVHEGGVRIERLDDGALRFVAPDGRPYVSAPTTGPAAAPAPLPSHAGGTEITAATAACRWRGERLDYGLAIEVLLAQRARAGHGTPGNVSAETSWSMTEAGRPPLAGAARR